MNTFTFGARIYVQTWNFVPSITGAPSLQHSLLLSHKRFYLSRKDETFNKISETLIVCSREEQKRNSSLNEHERMYLANTINWNHDAT